MLLANWKKSEKIRERAFTIRELRWE